MCVYRIKDILETINPVGHLKSTRLHDIAGTAFFTVFWEREIVVFRVKSAG